MAKIIEITNPLTGQPQEVIQSDFTAQQIDDAVATVLGGGGGVEIVNSFNGRTGKVVPKAGDYTAKDVGAAPDGYGLGERAKRLTSADDLNNIWENGWYFWESDKPANAPNMSPGNGNDTYIFMRVSNYDSQNVLQEFWSLNQDAQNQARRINRNGTWGQLEWYNPPMKIGVEYRTTERWVENPVYAKYVNFGNAPNATVKSVAHNIENFSQCAGWSGILSGANLQGHSGISSVDINATSITITTDKDLSASTIYVALKYTKNRIEEVPP